MSPQVSFLWGVLKIPSKCKLTFSSPPQKHLEKCGLHFGYVPPLKTVGDVIFAGDIPAIFASSQFLNLVPATTGRFRSWRRKHYATGRIHGEELFEGTETAAGKARKVSNPELDEYSPAFLLGDGFCQDYCNKPIIFEGFLFISKQPFFSPGKLGIYEPGGGINSISWIRMPVGNWLKTVVVNQLHTITPVKDLLPSVVKVGCIII